MKKQTSKAGKLKTVLPASINTISEAKKLLRDLYNNREAYHPEDDAVYCLQGTATKEQGELLNKLMVDIYNLEGNNGNHANPIFDPCKFLLQEAEIIKIIDLSGRGFTSKVNANDLLDSLGQIKPVPTVFNVALLDKNGDHIDDTQIDEHSEEVAWEVFTETGHKKVEGMTLEFDEVPDNEAEEDAQDVENRELAEWIERAEDGDEYQTNNTKYIRIN